MKITEEFLDSLFKPSFCVVDVDNVDSVELINGYLPSKIIRTRNGFHLYFEYMPLDCPNAKELVDLYNGDPISSCREGRKYVKECSIIDGHRYVDVMNNFVLCQDCLKVLPYTDERHNGLELCKCGGDLCGCGSCSDTIHQLQNGEINLATLNLPNESFTKWTPENGIE